MERVPADTPFMTMEEAALLALNPFIDEPSDPIEMQDPFGDFDFGDMVESSSPVDPEPAISEAPSSAQIIDRTALFTRLQEKQAVLAHAMSQVAAAAANTDCICPPQKLADGRVVHGNPVTLFAREGAAPVKTDETAANEATNQKYMVTEGCRPGYVHLYSPDGSYTEMTKEDAVVVMQGAPSEDAQDELEVRRYEKTLARLGIDRSQAADWQAAYSMGAVKTGSHAHGAGCNHGGSTTSGVPGSAASSIGGGGQAPTGGGLGTGGHDHGNHEKHDHCSSCKEGHIHDGKCENCGAQAAKAA